MIDSPTPVTTVAGSHAARSLPPRRRLRSRVLAGAALFSMLSFVASTGAVAVSTRTPVAASALSISTAAPSGSPIQWSSPAALPTPAAADDPDASTYTWGVDPKQRDDEPYRANFAFDLKPGQEVKDTVRVHNRSGGVIELRLYATDAYNSPTGALDLLAGDQDPKDVGDWISIAPATIRIAPAERREIDFTLRVPDNAEPGDHVGGIVTSLIREEGGPTAVTVDRRAATRVQVRVDGPLTPQLAITNLTTTWNGTLNPLGRGTVETSYTVTNTGNVRMGANQIIKAKSPIGFPSRTYRPDPIQELLPGSEISLTYAVDGVWPTFRTGTKVTLEAVPTVNNDDYNVTTAGDSASAGNWTIPWALIVALILAAVAWRIHQERQRRQQADQERRLQDLVIAAFEPEEPASNGNGNGVHPQPVQQPQYLGDGGPGVKR